MRRAPALVNAKGESAINKMTGDASIYDMVEAGGNLNLAPEVEEALEQKMKSLLGDPDDFNARYVLEILFTDDRSLHKPFGGMLMVWTNGGYAHGGGDEKVYLCPHKVDKNGQTKHCGAPIPPSLVMHGLAACAVCKNPSHDKDLVGEVFFRIPMVSWAKVVERYFYRLDCQADIRIGILKGDLHAAAISEQERENRGDKLETVRKEREWVKYSLPALIKDGTSGASLNSRFSAFLKG